MASLTVQVAQSATSKFQFNAAVDEFVPPANFALNPAAKEFKFSPLAVQTSPTLQTINFDSYSSDDEAPRTEARRTSMVGVRLPLGLKAHLLAVKSKRLNAKAEEFVPPQPKANKPTAPARPPPGLEKSLGLSVHAKEFIPPTPASHCAINLDDYTDDESEDESIDVKKWQGVGGRLASPYIWSHDTDKEELMDKEVLSDSEADTAEPSTGDSDSEVCSGCESP